MSRSVGNIFQDSIEKSCDEKDIFFHNIKDVFLPPSVRGRVSLPKNKYDAIIYYKGFLFPIELKTTAQKSLSFAAIAPHQIESLSETKYYQGVKGGLLVNFRELEDNPTYFIPIDRFTRYMNYAKNIYEDVRDGKIPNPYINKMNRASIPELICKEIGISIDSELMRKNYRYDIMRGLDDIISFG